jgi:hypothetical protein
VHSLFVAQDPVHVVYGWEGMVVKARVILVTLDGSESSVHGVERLLSVSDARQEQAIVKLRLHGLRIDSRLDLFLSFFFYQWLNLCIVTLWHRKIWLAGVRLKTPLAILLS